MGLDEEYDGGHFVQCGQDVQTATASPLALTANLITATLGCGILSLPWATAGASLLPAVGLTLLVLAINAGTNLILVFAAERHQVFDLGGLLGRLRGRWGTLAKATCEVTIWLTVFLCLVGYLVVVADTLTQFLPNLPRSAAVIMGCTAVLPLCFLDQQHLAFSSSLTIGANVYVFAILMVYFLSDWEKPFHECCILGFGHGSMTMVSVLMQAAVVQMCVLPMYEQLERRSPLRFSKCLGVSFCFVSMLFIAFSCVAYLMFGRHVKSNILLDLPPSPSGTLARVGMAAAVLGVYPLLLSSMVAPLKRREEVSSTEIIKSLPLAQSLCRQLLERPEQLATIAIVVCSGATALLTSDLGKLNVVSGASQVAVFVGLAPGLIGLDLMEGPSWLWRSLMLLLIAVAICVSVLGLTFTDNFSDEMQAGCLWAGSKTRQAKS